MLPLRRLFDYVIPGLLCCYIAWGWYVVVFEVGIGWLLRMRNYWIAIPYLVVVSTLLLCLSSLYYTLLSLPSDHSTPPPHPPLPLLLRCVPFECGDDKGSLPVCLKGSCNGRWKPPGARHCSTCQTCRIGYDHHCPWIGNCVTIQNRPHFLLFLFLTSIAVSLAIVPVALPVFQHARDAYHLSETDPDIRANWWDWKWSWIVFGGPIGRWTGGIILGYHALQIKRAENGPPEMRLGAFIAEPRLGAFFTITLGVLLTIFCAVLAWIALFDIGCGVTTVERRYRQKYRGMMCHEPLVWIPSQASTGSSVDGTTPWNGVAVAALPQECLYDMGWKRNMAALWRAWKAGPQGREYTIPVLNPSMLKRMQETIKATGDGRDVSDVVSAPGWPKVS